MNAFIVLIVLVKIFCNFTVCEQNNLYIFDEYENCKEIEYFDVNYLKCKPCYTNLYLKPSENSK